VPQLRGQGDRVGTMNDTLNGILGFGGLMLVIIGVWVLYSHQEAETFTRLTGKPVTTREAMFLDLRVQEGIK